MHHFRRARSSCCLWATSGCGSTPPSSSLTSGMSPPLEPRVSPRVGHQPPAPPAPGVPRCWRCRGDRLRCPVRGAPGPPRRPPLMRVSGRSIVAPLCLPRFSRSAQNLPWKPEPAAAPGNPQAQLGNANRNANSCLDFQGSQSCPWATDVPRPLMCPGHSSPHLWGWGRCRGRA